MQLTPAAGLWGHSPAASDPNCRGYGNSRADSNKAPTNQGHQATTHGFLRPVGNCILGQLRSQR